MASWELLYSACFTPGFPMYGEFILLYSPFPLFKLLYISLLKEVAISFQKAIETQ